MEEELVLIQVHQDKIVREGTHLYLKRSWRNHCESVSETIGNVALKEEKEAVQI